ncbi:MAG: lamin tail domain-containing protein [Patescibacteria group bacterium]
MKIKILILVWMFFWLMTPVSLASAESLNTANTTSGNIYQYFIFTCSTADCLQTALASLNFENNLADPTVLIVENEQNLETTTQNTDLENSTPAVSSAVDDETSADDQSSDTNTESATENQTTELLSEESAEEEIVIYPALAIRLSEIYPTPKTGEKEWVEIFNSTDQAIDLSGWEIYENGNKATALVGIVNVGEYKMFEKGSLNNDGDTLTLFDPTGKLIDALSYGNFTNEFNHISAVPKSGESIILSGENYFISEQATPNVENIYLTTVEQSAQNVSVNNESNDLTVIASSANVVEPPTVETQTNVVVFNNNENEEINSAVSSAIFQNQNETSGQELAVDNFAPTIRINEIMPAPSAGGEWVELYNFGLAPVNLKDFFLDDADGGSVPYKIKEDFFVEADNFVVFDQLQTKLSLNNSGDQVRLLSPTGRIIDSTVFEKAPKDQSWAYVGNGYEFTKEISKNHENIIPRSELKAGTTLTMAKAQTGIFTNSTTKAKTVTANKASYQVISLTDFSKQIKGSTVALRGSAIAELNIFGTKTAYLNGAELYFGKDFAVPFSREEIIAVKGEVSDYAGGKRLLIREITATNSQEKIVPKEINVADFSTSLQNMLVKVKGKYLDKIKEEYFFSDNGAEFVVKLNKNMKLETPMEINKEYALSGLLFLKNNKFSLNLRDNMDISLIVPDDLSSKSSELAFSLQSAGNNYYWWGGLGASLIVFGLLFVFIKIRKFKFWQ